MKVIRCTLLLAVVLAMGACASAAQPAPREDTSVTPQTARPNRTMTIAVRSEASSAAAKALLTSGSNITPPILFNAGLAVLDQKEVPHAYLAEALPQLNTDSWRVFPDGRMETTYRLRPDLKWHDGTALSAEDFVFALRVYQNPQYGSSSPRPQNIIERIQAPDERTVVIQWTQPYFGANSLESVDLQALPRHILAAPLEQLEPENFAAHPFWTLEYVGLGPYRITRWEPGVALEATAFDNHVLGRPKVDRIRVVYIADPNTVLANLLAGTVDVATTNSLPFNQALVLRREWGSSGVVLVEATTSRTTEFQLHPDRVPLSFAGTLDVRVRRAIAHAIDKQAINETVFEGQGIPADIRILPTVDFFPAVDRVIRRYPFDLRRSEQLMNEVGYTKGADGIFVGPTGARMVGVDWIAANPQSELTQQIMLDSWKRGGFEITSHFLSTVEQRDARIRAERPGLYTGDGGSMETLGSDSIPRPENRWTGSNRGSYSSPEYDRFLNAWNGALDRNERNRNMTEMARVYTEDLPSIPIHYNLAVTAQTADLTGVAEGGRDIHLWKFR